MVERNKKSNTNKDEALLKVLKELNMTLQRQHPPAMEKLLLSLKEVSHALGLSSSAIYDYNDRGLIPSPIKIGRSPKWRSQELKKWVAAGCPCRKLWEQNKKMI